MSALERIATVIQQGVTSAYPSTDKDAFLTAPCGHCGGSQHVVVARQIDPNTGKTLVGMTQWLRCVICLSGSVIDNQMLYPTAMPMKIPVGLPPTDAAIWDEVRACLGVGAYAAAVMLCRKLLFHVAVSNGLPPKNSKDRAPNFLEAVNHLESEGVITSKMRPWVDRVKDVGNDANHELTPIAKESALDVATFTEQLLVLAYELTALMSRPEIAAPALAADETTTI